MARLGPTLCRRVVRLRRDLFERPYDAARAAPSTRELLKARESLEGVARTLPDPRLTALATSDAVVAGHRPRRVPAWWGLQHYLRQTFDTWTVPAEQGGMARVRYSLAARLATRRVDVHTQMPVLDIALERGRLRGVHTASGLVAADRVVVAVDPRQLPSLRRFTRRATAALPPHVIHLGLAGDPPARGRTRWCCTVALISSYVREAGGPGLCWPLTPAAATRWRCWPSAG